MSSIKNMIVFLIFQNGETTPTLTLASQTEHLAPLLSESLPNSSIEPTTTMSNGRNVEMVHSYS